MYIENICEEKTKKKPSNLNIYVLSCKWYIKTLAFIRTFVLRCYVVSMLAKNNAQLYFLLFLTYLRQTLLYFTR